MVMEILGNSDNRITLQTLTAAVSTFKSSKNSGTFFKSEADVLKERKKAVFEPGKVETPNHGSLRRAPSLNENLLHAAFGKYFKFPLRIDSQKIVQLMVLIC